MNDLAVRTPNTGVDRDTWSLYIDITKYIAETQFVKKELRGNKHAVLACMLYGRALGIDPMIALQSIDVVDGRPAMSATLVNARVRERGHDLWWEEDRDDAGMLIAVTAYGKRADTGREGQFRFGVAEAKAAQLYDSRVNYTKYPTSMFWSRAVTQLARMLFADVFLGVAPYTPEELGVGSGGAPEVAASPENSSAPVPADGADGPPEEPPLAPASAASPEPTYPGLGFPRHAEGWMLLEDEWDQICESLNHDSPGEAQRLVDRWAELDHDAEAAIKTVRASDDTRVLHLFADREARANGRVTVLRAIQKRLEKLTLPLPESLQPASALTRFQALVGWVKEDPSRVGNPKAYTEYGLLQGIRARGLGQYMLLDQASDETLEHYWLQVPTGLRLTIEGLPAQEVTRLAGSG